MRVDTTPRRDSLPLTLMKSLRHSLLRSLVVPAIAMLTLNEAAADEPRFKALAEDYAAKAKIVSEMDRVILTDLKIENQTFEEAINTLERNDAGNKGAVINFVIRKPLLDAGAKDENAPSPAPERISFSAAKISFAAALDELCQKTNHQWSIDLDEKGSPLLVIAPQAD